MQARACLVPARPEVPAVAAPGRRPASAAIVLVAIPVQDSPCVAQQGGITMPEGAHEAPHVQDPLPASRVERLGLTEGRQIRREDSPVVVENTFSAAAFSTASASVTARIAGIAGSPDTMH